jgi:hypothetical protein
MSKSKLSTYLDRRTEGAKGATGTTGATGATEGTTEGTSSGMCPVLGTDAAMLRHILAFARFLAFFFFKPLAWLAGKLSKCHGQTKKTLRTTYISCCASPTVISSQ